MLELRLIPTAVAAWLGVGVLLVTRELAWALGAVALLAAVAAACRHFGQTILTGLVAGLSVLGAQVRRRQAEAFEPGGTLHGTLAADPVAVEHGGWRVSVHVTGYPEPLTIFTDTAAIGLTTAGTPVAIDASWADSDRPGLGQLVGQGGVVPTGEPGLALATAGHVRASLVDTVTHTLSGEHRGLLPGMALGDTSLQTPAAEEAYVATGLSHLSAVSGANVAIVTTAALLVCRAFALGPRVQTVAALGALAAYVLIVGTEPSVLRAAITGLVGLVAVVSSSRMQPLHALALAIIVLMIAQPHLAVAYGFALSVAATFGIIALTPLIAAPFHEAGLPDVLARAVAVAIAADLVTMPIVALMTGKVSVVSAAANILAAPAAAPVTILGLIAALLAVTPGAGPVASLVVWITAPLTGWIHLVATSLAALPAVTIELHPVTVLIGYGWILAGILFRRLVTTAAILIVAATLVFFPSPRAPTIDPATLRTATIDSLDDLASVPAGTQAIIVTDPAGQPAPRPTVTADGVPVLFPHRDGAVTLHTDGTQHARDGRF